MVTFESASAFPSSVRDRATGITAVPKGAPWPILRGGATTAARAFGVRCSQTEKAPPEPLDLSSATRLTKLKTSKLG